MAIDGDPEAKQRAPLQVSANGDGTFTIIDGNATAQAAMLAGWKRLPVEVVAKRAGWVRLAPTAPPPSPLQLPAPPAPG